MGVLALVNLLAIAMLFPVALRLIRDYRAQLDAGIEHPVLDTAVWSDLDIDPTGWSDGAPAKPASTA
jgi:AGCS family alanine or glycine:cation symporter